MMEEQSVQALHARQFNNGYGIYIRDNQSIGFLAQNARHLNSSHEPLLAEEYLVNSYLDENDAEIASAIFTYLSDPGVLMVSSSGLVDYSGHEVKELKDASDLHYNLGLALENRKSTRNFTGNFVEEGDLAALVRAASAVSRDSHVQLNDGQAVMHHRTAPSAGGLYPVTLLIYTHKVSSLEKGILYQYMPREDIYIKISEIDFKSIRSLFGINDDFLRLEDAACIFFYAIRPWKTLKKYGNRGLRLIFQEVGAICQNVNLACASLGLGVLECASFYETRANNLLGFDGRYQSVIHTQIIGTTI